MPVDALSVDPRPVATAGIHDDPMTPFTTELRMPTRRIKIGVGIERDIAIRHAPHAHDVFVERIGPPGMCSERLMETERHPAT